MLLLSVSYFVMAQRTVSGKVTSSENQQAVAGATVSVKGTKKQTTTDASGIFKIDAADNDIIVISSVGFTTQEKKAGESAAIVLQIDSKSMNEVVVTALGIKKETKRLGYSVQEVKGADLIKAREPNALNALAGKISGLSVGGSPEILGRPQLILRGGNLNFVVIDGIPINSDTWNINPDDVETYTVLKGATAAALYGNRGANGAIIITTKKGTKDKRGYSVEFNSSTMFERGFNSIPMVQDRKSVV